MKRLFNSQPLLDIFYLVGNYPQGDRYHLESLSAYYSYHDMMSGRPGQLFDQVEKQDRF